MQVKLIHKNSKLPKKAHSNDAGYDLFPSETVLVKAGKTQLISTGVQVQLKHSEPFYIRVAPRSSLSSKGIIVGAGVVDTGYTGEIKVVLHNVSDVNYQVTPAKAIAQLIPTKIINVDVKKVDEFTEETFSGLSEEAEKGIESIKVPKKRGRKAFGSTDKKEVEAEQEEKQEEKIEV